MGGSGVPHGREVTAARWILGELVTSPSQWETEQFVGASVQLASSTFMQPWTPCPGCSPLQKGLPISTNVIKIIPPRHAQRPIFT